MAEVNGWNDDIKALELATSLRDSAQSVLSDLDADGRRNYHSLVAALTTRFEPANFSEVFRAELKYRVRNPGEKLCDLAQDIKRLVRKAYMDDPKTTRDKIARDAFIDSLNDSDMEWSVHQQKPHTIDHALQYAIEYESFQKGRIRRVGERRGLRMQTITKPTEVLSSTPSEQTFAEEIHNTCEVTYRETETSSQDNFPPEAVEVPTLNQQRQFRETLASSNTNNKKVCWFCNTQGHFKKECRKYAAWIKAHENSGNACQLPSQA